MIQLRTDQEAVLLPVKVVPGASRTRFMGELGGRAKIAVAAPAEKGKANGALIAFLAKQLGLRRQDVTVTQGQTSPTKTVRLAGIAVSEVARLLGLDEK